MLIIREQVDLRHYNTFGVKASAHHFVTIHSIQEAHELFQSDLFKNEKHFFLGGGSNVLFTKDYEGLVIKVDIKGIKIIAEDDDKITLQVGAGENWHALVEYCVDRNYGGIENLSLIPGTMGAAPIQNIGAYGVEIKKNIDAVEAIEISSCRVINFSKVECEFGYRESIFKQRYKDKYFISSVILTLTKKNHHYTINYGALAETIKQQAVSTLTVKAISDAVIRIRKSKLPDPAMIGNAGSFFKNPSIEADLYDILKKQHPTLPSYPAEKGLIKIPAAWLIDYCGWKGKTFNNIGVHHEQALVLVNYGGGEGKDIWQLAMKIKADVEEKFNIILQPEVSMI